MSCRLPEHGGTWNSCGQPVDCPCDGNGNFGAATTSEDIVDIGGITYSALVQATETTQYNINTAFFGGTWYWYAYLHDQANGMTILERHHSDTLRFWLTSEDAMADAIHHFTALSDDREQPSYPEDAYADDYPGEIVPTGWDAREHKALYE